MNTGAKLRDYHFARQLARRFEVTCLAFAEEDAQKAPGDDIASLFQGIELAPRGKNYTPLKLASGLLGRLPVTVLNYTTEAMQNKLRQLLDENDFDAVQFESVHLAQYLPIARAAKSSPIIIYDWHNIESELMYRYSENAANRAKAFYAKATAQRIAALEGKILMQSDAVCVPSTREKELLGQRWPDSCPVHVIENGVDTAYYNDKALDGAVAKAGWRTDDIKRDSLIYVGSMDYHANIDAMTHFVANTWPRLHAAHPDLKLKIIGRNPTPAIKALSASRGVTITGGVPDVRPYYQQAVAAIVPLRVGGGTRLKILEAMAANVPVVSSRIGAEGLDYQPNENILMAENADEFTSAISRIRNEPELRRSLQQNGRKLVQKRYDWSAIGAKLHKCYDQHFAK